MKKMTLMWLFVLGVVLSFAGVGQAANAVFDASGQWEFAAANGYDNCATDMPEPDRIGAIVLTQLGDNSFSIVDEIGAEYQGIIEGASYVFKKTNLAFAEDGGRTGSISDTLMITFSTSTFGTGYSRGEWRSESGDEFCTWGQEYTYRKIGAAVAGSAPVAAATSLTNIYGKITSNDTPVVALVLASGQYMFSSSLDGSFSLNVPLESDGMINLQIYCSGKSPYVKRISPSAGLNMAINLEQAAASSSRTVTSSRKDSTRKCGYANIYGTIKENGAPLCAMALANGQYAFTCSGDGSYNLDVPIDSNGRITLQTFASGRPPSREMFSYAVSTSCDAIDDDGDGFTENQGDCNDNSASINPNATDTCGDGIDQDCNGSDKTCSSSSYSLPQYSDYSTINPVMSGECSGIMSILGCGSASSCMIIGTTGTMEINMNGLNMSMSVNGQFSATGSINSAYSDNSFVANYYVSNSYSGCDLNINMGITGHSISATSYTGEVDVDISLAGSCMGYSADCQISADYTATQNSSTRGYALPMMSTNNYSPIFEEEVKNIVKSIYGVE